MPFAFHYAARSDVGMVRTNNEDSAYAGPHLLAMADGMGGHAGGDVASSTVIAALVDLDDEALSGRELSSALLDRILAANAEIGDQVRRPTARGDGHDASSRCSEPATRSCSRTSATRGRSWRATAWSPRSPRTTPSCRAWSTRAGSAPSEAHTHPQRSLVTRVLTGAHDDEPDLVVRQGRIGDRYLIASDGLTDYVAQETVDEVLTTVKDPGECADRLVSLALRAGAPDNVTVVVGDLVDISRDMTPPTSPRSWARPRCRSGVPVPSPTTPAAKAAALTAEATAGDRHSGEGLTLAEEGPRSRRTTVLRVAALLVVAAVVVAGGSVPRTPGPSSGTSSPPTTAWSPSFRGVDQNLGRCRCPVPSTRRRSPSTTCHPPTRPASRAASRSRTGTQRTCGSATSGCRRQPAAGPGPTARRAGPSPPRGPLRPHAQPVGTPGSVTPTPTGGPVPSPGSSGIPSPSTTAAGAPS